MKATLSPLKTRLDVSNPALATALTEPVSISPALAEKSLVTVFCELIKIRLTSLVIITTLVGFYLGTKGALDYGLMFHTLLGTALVACGASALNQLLEQEHDAKMRRTQDRPLPSGRLQPRTVLIFGLVCSMAGLAHLALLVNPLACLLGAVTLAIYLLVYTPLKRVTWLNTQVGAIPGGLPPLIGWAAAQNQLGQGGWSLFAIMFFWQIAHFLAIAWLYRDEYAKAGFVMLPAVDPTGTRTARLTVCHTFGLLLVSLLPVVFGVVGVVYLAGALILGGIFLSVALQFARHLTLREARLTFYISIIYLPILFGISVLDKVKV